MSNDEHFMQIALDEANRARGLTSPNPLVGAVIVKDGQILSKGYHHRAGLPHAEVEALAPLGGKAPGATMYVNLEPCSHTGRTPPCSAAVIKAGIKRVVIGVQDPDPRVNGNGIRLLEEAGIEVTTGVLEQASIALNAAFFTAIQKRRPRVSLKVATSLDAQIATHTGDAKWLSGEPARKWAHQMRVEHDAIRQHARYRAIEEEKRRKNRIRADARAANVGVATDGLANRFREESDAAFKGASRNSIHAADRAQAVRTDVAKVLKGLKPTVTTFTADGSEERDVYSLSRRRSSMRSVSK